MRLRCERDSDTKPHVKLLKAKLTDGLSASLASVCQKVNLAGGLTQQPEVAKSSFARSGSLSRTDRPSSPFLSLVYASRAFRHWWLTHETESTHEQKMCVSYRSYDLNLITSTTTSVRCSASRPRCMTSWRRPPPER